MKKYRAMSLDTQKPELSISGALTLEQRVSALEQTLANIKELL